MSKFQIIAAVITYFVASVALATNTTPPASNSSATSTSSSQATGVGIGGNSSSNATGGKSSSTSKVDNKNTNTNVGVNTQGQSQTGINKNDNRDTNTNVNGQSQTAKGGNASQGQAQGQGQKQGQGQTQKASSDQSQGQSQAANNEGNTQATTINTKVEDRLQAPDVSVANVYPTAPCLKGGSLGLSVPGGSISGAKSGKTDVGCELRETARSFLSMEEDDMAYRLLCASPVVQEYVGTEICLQSRTKHEPVDVVTHAELKQHEDRIVKGLSRK